MKRLLTYLTVAIIMLMVPIGVLAEDFYLRSGLNANEGNSYYSWNNNDNAYKFEQNGSEYTYEVDLTGRSGDFTFRVARGKDGTTWSPGSDQTQTIKLGTTYTTMSQKTSGGWIIAENTAESKKYLITIGTSSDGEWTWPTSVKVEAASTATFKKGLYIYGAKYDGISPSYLHYKLLPLNGSTTEYYIDLLADDKTLAGCNRYSTGSDVSDTDANNDTSHATFWADMNNSTFKLAYVATDDSPITTTYGSASGSQYKLQTGDGTNATSKSFGGDNWQVVNNGGMYRFIVTVNASGVPQSWRYEKYPNQLVIYKLSAASHWTIDGFFYCTHADGANTSGNYHGYNQKFFGTTNFTKDGEFAFLLGNKWFKRNKNNESKQYTKNTSWDDTGSAPNLKFKHATGTYGAMFDPTQDEYFLVGPSGSTEEPVRIYMIGNAVGTSETSDDFNDWDTSKSTELTYSKEEGCWKGTIDLKNGKYMRFLYNNVKNKNFGEDSYAPTADGTCTNGDTQLNNHVSYNNAAAGGTNINFLKSSGTYTVRFYMDAAKGKDFTSEATYWYTLELVSAPAPEISPKGGFYINKVEVTVTNGTAPYTYEVYESSSATTPVRTGNISGSTFMLSTPGYLKVIDVNGKEALGDANGFDFTYSTSENYANYYNNGTTSQAVETGGGKDAVSLFVKKQGEGDMYIYAWDYTWDRQIKKYQDKKESELDEATLADIQKLSGVTQDGNSGGEASTKQRDPHVKLTKEFPGNFMSDARTMTINGDEYYYLTFSKDKLHKADDEIGLVVNKGSSKNKTADNHFNDNAYLVFSNVNGYTINGEPNANFALYEFKKEHSEDGYVYFEVPSVDGSSWKNGNIYCYAYDGSSDNGWPGTDAKGNMTLVRGTSNVYYYLVPDGKRGNLIFMSTNDIDNTRTTANLKPGYTYQSHGYYRPNLGENGTAVTTISQMTEESHTALETFYNTEPVIVVETRNYPNGEDYYNNMPCDLTYLLDPTWGGAINPKSTDDEEWSIAHWSGYPASQKEGDELVTGYRKRITTENLSQTVIGLNQNKTYTVQALVRAEGENNVNLALSLNGATNGDAYHQMKALHASGAEGSYVNKFGRVEYLTPTDWTNKQEGIGWFKLEASAKPNNAGNLVISLTRSTNGSYFDLADVTLIENANDTEGRNYHTSAKYAAGDFTGQAVDAAGDSYTSAWYADYSDRQSTATTQKNNAYSFFDRGRNVNAIVFASPETTIAMSDAVATSLGETTPHRHPYNVVTKEGTDATCDVVYLTDYGIEKTMTGFATSDADYFMTGYGYGSKYDFGAKKVIFDRNFNTGTTTLCLPFAIAPATLRTLLNGGSSESNVKIYTLASADLTKKSVEYQAVSESGDIAAFTPLIIKDLVAGEHMKNASLLTKERYDIAFAADTNNKLHTITLEDNGTKTADFNGVTTMTGFYSEGTTDNKAWMNFLFDAQAGDNFGKFVWAEPWDGYFAGYIKPFRCYMTLWGEAANGESKEFNIVWNNTPAEPANPTVEPTDPTEPQNPSEETTGITTIDQLLMSGPVFTIDGRLVSRTAGVNGLQKGIYMVNGKKFVIK